MTISSTNRKAGPFIGNGTATVFPFYFKVFAAADVEVVRLNVSTNVETILALTTDYTVSLNTDQNANPGGSITLVAGALATGFNLVVTSDIGNLQPTDLTNQGGFYPDVINDALDRATIQIQQLQEGLDRAALLPITSAADSAALVADIVRLADSADNLDIDANNIGAINTVATNITSVNTVATNIASVNAVAGNATNINAVNANKTNIDAVGSDLLEPVSEINTVAVNITNVNTVGDNITNVNAVAGNSTNINAVAGNATNINAVNANKTNIDAVAGNNSNITAVAGNSTNINAVNANKTNIDAVAGNATNINAVNANKTNIDTVAAANTAINTVSTNIVAVNSAYTNIAAIIDAPNQAAAAANSAAQAAASAASGMYSAVQDKSANYTIVAADAGDLIRVTTTSGAVTITLPLIGSTGITDGFKIAIVKWTADANAVNIARSGSNTINGATSAQIGSQYSQIILVADAETSTWFASQSGLGATNINVDTFNGTGSATAFTLTSDPSTKNNTSVFISGVYQQKSTYSLSGVTLTFSTAPPAGTANIEVAYSTPLAIGTPSDGTVTAAKMAAGAAVGNLGYTPVNKAGDTMTGSLNLNGTQVQVKIQTSSAVQYSALWLRDTNLTSEYSVDLAPSGVVEQWHNDGSTWRPKIRFPVGSGVELPYGQLKFPASQNASSDANTLDDYEEGAWTPTLETTSGSPTYTSQLGSYTKIGRLVTAGFFLYISSKNTLAAGTLRIGGLPFNISNTPSKYECVKAYVDWYQPSGTAVSALRLDGNNNSNIAYLYKVVNAQIDGTGSVFSTSDVSAVFLVRGTLTYMVD